MKVLLLYLPVWHRGYRELFASVQDELDAVWLIDGLWAADQFSELSYLRKEARALSAQEMKPALRALYPHLPIEIIGNGSENTRGESEENGQTKNKAKVVNLSRAYKIVSALTITAEDVARAVAKRWLPQVPTEEKSIFLRWTRESALVNREPEVATTLAPTELAQRLLGQAYEAAAKSSDWWRHVGAVLAQGETVLFAAANRHQPNDHTPYLVGDVRQLFHRGEYLDYSTAEHAETSVIAEAARRGTPTRGAQLFVTTFPCPYCARLIAHAGISELYYAEGYATLDGEEILKQAGVTLHRVTPPPALVGKEDNSSRLLPPYSK